MKPYIDNMELNVSVIMYDNNKCSTICILYAVSMTTSENISQPA